MLEIIDVREPLTLDDYASYAHLASAVEEMRTAAAAAVERLKGRRVWMVNSTSLGGGVAEMMPRLVAMMSELGLPTKWAVIRSDEPRFFALTKRIHNLLHGHGEAHLTTADRALYESVNRQNADELRSRLEPNDILVVHDPQPMALGAMLQEELNIPAFWRCHIGLDKTTPETEAGWNFLRPFAEHYDCAIFSAAEYVPPFFSDKSAVIAPSIDPLDHKNRDLPAVKLTGILCNAGLALAHSPTLTPPFEKCAERLQSGCRFGPATEPDEIGLQFRPIVVQVSRWDRLKGWLPLLRAFAQLKRMKASGRHQRRLEIVRLVMAGPDPESVQDDPQAREVLAELCDAWDKLEPQLQRDIVILKLPLSSQKENALMINALQRCASVVVQNSIEEGFGLTATEAMYKGVAFLGTGAHGLRQQICDRTDGRLIRSGEDSEELAAALNEMLADPQTRGVYGRRAQKRAHKDFLVFTQVRRWLEFFASRVPEAN